MPEVANHAIPLRSGVNYAPLQPLLDLKSTAQTRDAHYLTEAIVERYNHHMSVDRETFDDLNMMGHLNSLFIQGKQNLRFNNFTKSFYVAPAHKAESSKLRTTPIMRFYETNCESRYTSSNPKVNVTAGREDDKCRQAAQAGSVIVDFHEKKLYTNWHNGNDALLMMSFGTQIDRIKWDSSAKGFKAFRDIFEDKEFPISAGVGQCFDCGHHGTGVEYLTKPPVPVCPNCGSQNAYAEPPTTQIIPVRAGQKEINLGAITIEQLEFPACRWNLRFKAEESSYFIYEQMIPLGALQNLIGNVNLEDGGRGANDLGLSIVDSLSASGAAANEQVSSQDVKTRMYRRQFKATEFYFSPEDVAGVKVRGDEKTVSGQELPQGGDLSEIYPEGGVAVLINGKYLLGLYGKESHKDQLNTGVWHKRHFSGAGQGIDSATEINRRLNETESQGYLAMKHNSTPGTLVAEGSVEKEYMDYVGMPDVVIPVNLDSFNGRSINDLIASPKIGNIDLGIISYFSENLRNMMQLTMNSTNFAGGLPGVNNKTATGAQITEANASSIFAPMLGIKVDKRIRAARMFVELYRTNVPVQQFFPLASRYGAQQGVWLSGANVDTDLNFEVVQNSELPRNAYSIREDNDRFFLTVGGAQGLYMLKQQDPEFADELMRRYGVDFETNHADEVAQICRERFEAAKVLIKQFAQIPQMVPSVEPQALMMPTAPTENVIPMQENEGVYELQTDDGAPDGNTPPPVQNNQSQPAPQVMQTQTLMPQVPINPLELMAMEIVKNIQPPLSVYESFHLDKGEWFSKFLDTDEGKRMDLLSRNVVYKFIETHFVLGAQAAAMKAQLQGQVALAGQMPGQMADVAKQQYLNANNPQNQGK